MITDREDYVELLDHNIKLNEEILRCQNVSALPLDWGNLEQVETNKAPDDRYWDAEPYVADQRSFEVLQTPARWGFGRHSTGVRLCILQGLTSSWLGWPSYWQTYFRNQLKILLRRSSCYPLTALRYFWHLRKETQRSNLKLWKCFLKRWKHISLGRRYLTPSTIKTFKVPTFRYLISRCRKSNKIVSFPLSSRPLWISRIESLRSQSSVEGFPIRIPLTS